MADVRYTGNEDDCGAGSRKDDSIECPFERFPALSDADERECNAAFDCHSSGGIEKLSNVEYLPKSASN